MFLSHATSIYIYLIFQFSGPTVERMKLSYGAFCSGHKMAVGLYKDFLYKDRKFQTFIKVRSWLFSPFS